MRRLIFVYTASVAMSLTIGDIGTPRASLRFIEISPVERSGGWPARSDPRECCRSVSAILQRDRVQESSWITSKFASYPDCCTQCRSGRTVERTINRHTGMHVPPVFYHSCLNIYLGGL